MVITLLAFLIILAYEMANKLNIGFKRGILKMMLKSSVSSTHSATLEIRWHLSQKMTNFNERKTHFGGKIAGQGQIQTYKCFWNYKFNSS